MFMHMRMHRSLDGTLYYERVNRTRAILPDKLLLATEGCSCPGVGRY
jgi:hypothetical protein